MNISLSQKVLEALAAQGVKDILLCAGARNSPLVLLLSQSKGFRIWSFFEERSAGFFALGRSQRDQRPVAVITTSGTAVAELLPAAIEATYTQTPLIFVTADRPRSYRGTGAPQAIDQVGLFFKYVETCVDIASSKSAPVEEWDLSMWSRQAPLQINVCFDEPLIDESLPQLDFTNQIQQTLPLAKHFNTRQTKTLNQPLVVAGPLSVTEARFVAPFLEKLGAPIYAEALSNLHQIPSLKPFLLQSGERAISASFRKGWSQSLLRIGGVPTLRFWRDLEDVYSPLPVISVANSEWKGLSRPTIHLVGLENLSLIKVEWIKDSRPETFAWDREKKRALQSILERCPQSEIGLLHQLTEKTKAQFVYLGNSLPIREWDLANSLKGSEQCPQRHSGNRGANGIDGQLSSFLGGASHETENWAVVGDLTALYDLSSLWACQQMEPMKLRIVVVNNQGGMIFKNMFQNEIFLNKHSIEFSKWAEMWKWDYQKWNKIPSGQELPERVIIELVPDSDQSEHFWKEYSIL